MNSLLFLSISSAIVPQFNLIRGAFNAPDTNNTVEEALRQLAIDTKDKPLLIPFLGKDATASTSKLAVAKKIRKAISERNPQILTTAVVAKIIFSGIHLLPDALIKLKAYYIASPTYQYQVLFYAKENTKQTQAVCDALQKFNQKNPLHIDYLKSDATAVASKSTVTAKLRATLQKQNKIFTKKIVNNIKSDSTKLSPGKTVAVTAIYQSHAIVIYIAEKAKFRRRHSIQTIARKIRGEFYLKSVCLNKFMDDPLVTKMIRQTLVNYRILSESDASLVSADHIRLKNNSRHPLWVTTDDEKWAQSKYVTWHIESYSKITTWTVNDYDFHFLAYFSPGSYLWLRNILMHDPKLSTDEWFLGCLMQVLNDSNFDSDYIIIPWTDSLATKIFHWNNRLEEHMGHFGAWDENATETVIRMIHRIDRGWRMPLCRNIDNLIIILRYFFNCQTTKNNFGMMLDLEWSYNSGDFGMTLQSAHVW